MKPAENAKRISGSWFDFHHCNPYEGDYWNRFTNLFSAEDWRLKIKEMRDAGMDTLVLLSVALHGKSFYPSEHFVDRWNLECPDPLEAVLCACDEEKIRLFVGLGFFTTPAFHDFSLADETRALRRNVLQELISVYGHHSSFTGWYLPVEAGIQGHFPEGYIPYVNTVAEECRALAEKDLLIAPYGTRSIIFDRRFTEELGALDVDYIAYQDEIGVDRTTFERVDEQFAALRRVHDQVEKPLWADLETFRFEGKALVPGPFKRIRRQMEVLSPHVDKLICYQYHGLMNKPSSPVFIGHPDSAELYTAYMRYVNGLNA